ncbi:MAG: SCO1664 family protein [Marmoricola sp.]
MRGVDESDLLSGELVVEGRIMPASNHTFFARIGQTAVVYKPVSGERPLWDFPNGNLAAREYGASLIDAALGWHLVPETVLRDGPAGPGMVQRWCEPDGPEVVDVVPLGEVPTGWLHVLDAQDGEGRPVSLIHEDSLGLRKMALFDVVTNNTDRKGGHILSMANGHRYGVDHGICFHVEDKLRTVLWGWAGQELGAEERADLSALDQQLSDELGAALRGLIDADEVHATQQRLASLLDQGHFPVPSWEWPAIPWPPF